jgi:hypothetical protein
MSQAGSSLGPTAVSSGVVPSTNSVAVLSSARQLRPLGAGLGIMPLSADSVPGDHDANYNFIDSIGVCTKLTDASIGTPYANEATLKSVLLNLGVRHIRDGFTTQNLNNYENNLIDLANSGIHSELVLTTSEDTKNNEIVTIPATTAVAYLQAGHFAQSIEAIEGINEPDVNQGVPGAGVPNGWAAITQAQQKSLYTGVKALTTPAKRIMVYGPSVVNLASLSQVGDLSQYMDYGSVHDYSGGYNLAPTSIVSTLTSEATMSGSKPVRATENGYSTGTTGQGMPNVVMLDYAQRLFFKQFANNVSRTMWYQFLDQNATPNDYWNQSGLMTGTFAPKPAYVGLKNIIGLLKDQTPYTTRTALNVTFGGQAPYENLTQLLLQKNDGSYYLVVWSDVSEWTPGYVGQPGSFPTPAPAAYANTLNFLGSYVTSITAYTEDNTGAMTNAPVAVTGGNAAQIGVGPRPTIYKIVLGKAPAVAVPGASVIATPAAHWGLDEASGTVAVDSVNAAGNLTVPNIPLKVAWVSGVFNSGLGFSGTQAEETTATLIDTSQSYSATARVQMSNLVGFQAAVTVNGINQAAFALDFTPQSNLSYTTYPADAAGGCTRIGSTMKPVLGQWYAVAATFNGTSRKMSFYVNGVLQGTATAPSVFKGVGGTELGSMRAAGVGHYQWWNGGIDEVNLYQRELTPAEVATLAV